MTARAGVLLVAASFAACGCARPEKTPEATMAAMRESACAADVAGFFSHVDKARVRATIGGLPPATEDGGATPTTSLNATLGARVIAYMKPEIARALFNGWEKDVQLGKDGKLCRMTIGETRTTESSATVSWALAGERARVFDLERGADGRWIVVGLD